MFPIRRSVQTLSVQPVASQRSQLGSYAHPCRTDQDLQRLRRWTMLSDRRSLQFGQWVSEPFHSGSRADYSPSIDCLTDSPDVNASIEMTISDCLAQSEQYGQAGTGAGSGSSSSGASSASPVSGQGSSANTPATPATPVAGGQTPASTPAVGQTPASTPSPASAANPTSATSARTGRTGYGGGRGTWRRRDRVVKAVAPILSF